MLNLQKITEDTAAMILAGTKDGSLRKGIDLTTGLVGVNLQAPSKQLVALQSPFQQAIKRIVKPGANSDTWRTITALGSPMLFRGERLAGYKFSTTLVNTTATFRVAALGGEVTLEAQAASQGFDPALAKETSNCLLNSMKLEGQAFLGACATALGTPTGVAVAGVTTTPAGTIASNTYYVRIIAMTMMAANRVGLDVVGGYGALTAANAHLAGRSVTVVNPATDNAGAAITTGCGLSALSTEVNSGALTGPTSIKITWNAVPGAVAYAVFVGVATGAANLRCECIVTQTSVTLTSVVGTGLAASNATLPGTDQTADANSYDGIIPQLIASGSGAYLKNLAGTLTGAAGNGEIVEIQDAFAALFQSGKIGKFRVLVSGVDARTLTKLGVISNSMNIIAQPGTDGRVSLTAGAHIGQIINATTGDVCAVDVDPWLPAGTIVILPTEVPYNSANITDPFTWVGNYDWMRWDYSPNRSDGPIYPFEVRCNGALEGQFNAGCGLIYNIFKS
jgi:hypothetical protein